MPFSIPTWIHNLIPKAGSTRLTFLLLSIIAIIVLSFLINLFLMRSVGGIYRVFVAPGVIIHEISHAFGCLLTGAKIESINMFKKDGGEVRHKPSKIPIIGQIVISLAPFVIGALAIFLIAKAVGMRPIEANISQNLKFNFISQARINLHLMDFHSIRTWLALYLIIAIAVTMTPSWQDLQNISTSLLIISLIIYAVFMLGHWQINAASIIRPEILAVLGTVILILIACLILSIVVSVVASFFRRQ